ncbi:hydrophobin [Phlebiopsis gigantea 11061_1 CR5-6]|uniref:Hydrophobin n=1 Tax=Phlebiopsis gigantea (strain 11061_1 CR5-6) TaxID=745531 RepID=A0A0C3P156_PHLG1|nr:hydrophobin [Phlebiopsis gigantea 11061_1 CR5-6]
MFSRVSVVSVLALSLLAAATPAPLADKRWATPTTTPAVTKTVTVTTTATATSIPASSCTTGPIQCCQSMQSASAPQASLLLGLLNIVVQGVDVLVGLTCSPITVVGVGSGNSCSANTVCCENNSVGSLISIGCVPVIL